MKTQKKELVQQLLESLAPQLSSVISADQKTPKGVLKTVHHLADQLLRMRAKEEKRAAKAATLAPKEAKQKLTDELVAVLDAHFAAETLEEKASHLLVETAEELASKLTKLRSKQAQANKKKTDLPTEPEQEEAAPATTNKRTTRTAAKAASSVADAPAS